MADATVKMGVSGIAQFKQGMQQAQTSVKSLDAALKLNEKQYRATGDAEAYMQNKTSLLQQKLEAQKKAANDAKSALDAMRKGGVDPASEAFVRMQTALTNAQSAVLDTEAELQGLGNASEEAGKKTDKLSQELGGLNKKVSLDQVISAVGSITNGLEAGAKKAVDFGKALFDVIMDSARWADDTLTLATVLGLDQDTVQRMNKVAAEFEADAATIGGVWKKLRMNMTKDSDEVAQAFETLGVATQIFAQGKNGPFAVGLRDYKDVFWETGEALIKMAEDGTKAAEVERLAQTILGRSWDDVKVLFTAGREAYEEALDSQDTAEEEAMQNLATLNDKYSELIANWETLKAEALGYLAPALSKAADALSGLLGNVMDYLKSDEGKQALQDMSTAVSGLFEDLSEIDPEQVVEGFSKVFGEIVHGLEWMVNNEGTLKGILGTIVGAWATAKLAGGALQLYQLVTGLQGLAGGGAGGASSIGTTLGNALSTAAAVALKAAPWLAGLAVLLHTDSTANADIDTLFNEQTGELTTAGWEDWYNNPQNWKGVLDEVGALFGDLGSITKDRNAINAIARYSYSQDVDRLIREMEALGYIQKVKDEEKTTTTHTGEDGGIYDENGNRIGFQMPTYEGPVERRERMKKQLSVPDFSQLNTPYKETVYDPHAEVEPFATDDTVYYANVVPSLTDDAEGVLDEELAGLDPKVKAEPKIPDDAESQLQGALDKLDLSIGVWLLPKRPNGDIYMSPYANGLPTVPFDGWPALLHKGEQVVPAREVSARNYSSNLYVENMVMNGGTDAEGLAAAMAAAQRRTLSGYGS